MKALIQPTTILLLFIFVFCADQAITSAMSKLYIRAACYGVVALLALIALIVALIV